MRMISRHWLLVGGLCFGATIAALVFSLLSPRVYESTATLLLPKEGGASNLLGGLAASGLIGQIQGLGVPSLTPNRDMLVSVLKSRTTAQAVVEKFHLRERYQSLYLGDAVKRLQRLSNIAVSREGTIAVSVQDTDPVTAAAIANFYLEELDRRIQGYSTGEAAHQRTFLTQQLAQAKAQLEAAEESLRRFQERNRAVVLQEQTRGAIEAAARLKGEIVAAEVQMQVMRNFITEANPEVIALARRISEMKRQLAEMQYGDSALSAIPHAQARGQREFVVPFARIPEVGLELARLTRDVKVNETIVTLLTQHLEQAKLAEARDLPVVQVLDRAVPAERHSRPTILLNVVFSACLSFLAAVFLVSVLEYFGKTRGTDRPASR